MIRFEEDDESIASSIISRGELMHIVSKPSTQKQSKESLHPITILTLLDKNQQRVACTTLLDQCCTDNGIISWKLAKMLDLPTYNSVPKTFITAAGTFITDKIVKLTNAMLPCLSTSETFTIELMIIPKECSNDMSYGAIIGQDSMRTLDIDTSVRHNTISWQDKEIPMVSRDYWTAKRIQQQRKKLNKNTSKPTIKVADDKDIAPKELSSHNPDTTLMVHNNPKIKLPIKLENKVSIENNTSKQKTNLTLLATMDNKTQAFFMGEKSDETFNIPTTTSIHSYFHTQNKTNEAPTTNPTDKTRILIQASPNYNNTFLLHKHSTRMKQVPPQMTHGYITTDTIAEFKLPMT